ncbi:putative polyketide synthase [Xylariaceae sp. FL0255]|nr:putative polyketide synthase [Xylariaceae sp. FL0255]
MEDGQRLAQKPRLEEDEDAIAICGFSFKFPGEAISSNSFWDMLMAKRCATSPFPTSRFQSDGFYSEKGGLNTIRAPGGHFIKEDLAGFDAEFFSISSMEAASIDPMQRWLLETAFRALENAGITMDSVAGSSTGVYTGSFGLDYGIQINRDAECPPAYAGLGFGISMLANRLSWFFDLRGPSVGLDSACSSSAMAIDIACQALRSGSCSMSIVAGCNLTFSPETFTWLSNLHFLSPDSRCYSFDHRANGYARGEGIGVIILKRVSDAIRHGNTIRAVIRSTLSNEDGRTPGITQPSSQAQEALIKETYRRAGLSMKPTRYFEAHGTGTAIGDPREARAIGSSFEGARSSSDPIFVGALKSNIGHLEGASGIAGVIKTVLILERGIIPPNTNFEKINPEIDDSRLGIKFPDRSYPWPSNGLRRASINSFGYGGANSHIVLDDAYHYLSLRSLNGQHCTEMSLPGAINGVSGPRWNPAPETRNGHDKILCPKLLIWTSADEDGLDRIAKSYRDLAYPRSLQCMAWGKWLANLAYTLDSRRTHLPWRSYALIQSPGDLSEIHSLMSRPMRNSNERPRIGFVFSGQGAQWIGMGQELAHYTRFRLDLEYADEFLRSLGCGWSVIEELNKTEITSNIDHPELSQTLCTILQVCIVNLLGHFGIIPHAVVGHSSGEIAAAYAGGYISIESAWALAYFRGICSSDLLSPSYSGAKGAMIAAGVSEEHAEDIILKFKKKSESFGVGIACVNSPDNVTISGEEHIIHDIYQYLETTGIFTRKLRIPLAYHSRQMDIISHKYVDMIGSLDGTQKRKVPMISSVTGLRATSSQLTDPAYWALNMVETVRFSQAVSTLCAQSSISLIKKVDLSHLNACVVDHLLEIGPHATLQAPIRSILKKIPRGNSITYSAVLRRKSSAVDTMLSSIGELYNRGVKVNLRAVNEPHALGSETPSRDLLVDLPEYPFDHSQKYWHESRLSRNYRFREHLPSRYIGVRSRDWDPADARWRHFMKIEDVPWAKQHVVNGSMLYPGAGMLMMAVEAAGQLAVSKNKVVRGYTLQDVHLTAAMDLSAGTFEVQTRLRETAALSENMLTFDFTIQSFVRDSWTVNCRGSISAEFLNDGEKSWNDRKIEERQIAVVQQALERYRSCETQVNANDMYEYLKERSLEYGPSFRITQQQCYNGSGLAAAKIRFVDLDGGNESDGRQGRNHVIHPVTLDALMHLCFTAFTAGGSRDMATSVPSHFDSLWISNNILKKCTCRDMLGVLDITDVSKRGFTCNGVGIDREGSGDIRIWYEGLTLTSLSTTPKQLSLAKKTQQFCMTVDCNIAIDKLDTAQVYSVLEDACPAPEEDLTDLFEDLEVLIHESLEVLRGEITPKVLRDGEPWVKHYWNWAEHHLNRLSPIVSPSITPRVSSTQLHEHCDRLVGSGPIGELYSAVARNLVGLLKAEFNPLEILTRNDMLKNYYQMQTNFRCAAQISHYINLLAHQNAGMKILEVGGGTGAGTRSLTRALCTHPGKPETILRCDRYDFSDVSAAFLDKARAEFEQWKSQMTFGTLDIERSFSEQGYQDGEYDVVVAVSVLHITKSFKQTLLNVRRSMKPGGKLIMQESFNSKGWTLGFVFGVFPGWWFGAEDGRILSPSITLQQWDSLLKEVGFSGIDICLRDFDQDVAHHYGWVVSTAVDDATPAPLLSNGHGTRSRRAVIVIDQSSLEQKSLAKQITHGLRDKLGVASIIEDVSHVKAWKAGEGDDLLIFAADYGSPLLVDLDQRRWKAFRDLIPSYSHSLWVSSSGGRVSDPGYGMIDGLARTLRTENPGLHLVTLALSGVSTDPDDSKIDLLTTVISEMIAWTSPTSYEEEYIEVDGYLHTRRLVEANFVKSHMDSNLAPFRTLSLPIKSVGMFAMKTGEKVAEDYPFYIASEPLLACSDSDTIDITVKSVALHFQKPSRSMRDGRIWQDACAGVVLRSSPHSEFKIGDRVFATCGGVISGFSSQLRVTFKQAAKIPSHVTFEDACQYMPARLAAFEAISDIGQNPIGESVLVHQASNLVALSAIQLALNKGVTDIWATATGEKESSLISDTTGLPIDRILPSSWFESNPMLISPWKKRFHLILAPDSEQPSSLLFQCLVLQGRQVVYRSSGRPAEDLHGQAALYSPSTRSYGGEKPRGSLLLKAAFEYACALPHSVIPQNQESNSSNFPASELGKAMKTLHGVGSVVIKLDDEDIIKIRKPAQVDYQLCGDATYVVAGGLGGLGRSIARWLVSRGARNLLLLSRSGPRTPEAHDLIRELAEKHVRCETPPCNVAGRSSLRSVLAACRSRLPPIQGCIQAAMVMRESVFSKMTYDEWKDAVAPKVQGSWNLHLELPKGLDFFVMLSSVMGILGTGSLAGYNAGNTYQDALARHRVAAGENAVALDIGGVVDEGYLTELKNFRAGMQRSNEYVSLRAEEVCALLDIYCSPSKAMGVDNGEKSYCQILVGLRPPSHWKSIQATPFTLSQPLWGHMHHVPVPDGHGAEGRETGSSSGAESSRERERILALVASGSLAEAGEAACSALVDRVSSLLATPAARIDKHKSMQAYGIDSLSAIDLRNWVGEIFSADLPVFEILGGANFIDAGNSLARRMIKSKKPS